MPLGLLRLNERKQRPNANINFIKPLDGPDKDVAQDFLDRIAAQCFPVMQRDHISVMSLEEYAPNPEFLGRNFNAGEVIQLVLKDKGGRWLSFKFVQMVMMHELAHCKQMNHSRAFWAERNKYAKQMEDLWAKKYLGEGLWGRGQDLANGQYVHDHMPDQAQIPEHLCGGTYRRARGKKRKRGQDPAEERVKETYAERQQKRIARKFGKHGEGNAVGEDDLVRGALERGKSRQGKPKVASSKRGRDLRANAALARFEASKNAVKEETSESVKQEDSETESDDWDSDNDTNFQAGQISNSRDSGLVKVCGDEGEDEDGGQHEMNDLLYLRSQPTQPSSKPHTAADAAHLLGPETMLHEDSETESEPDLSTMGESADILEDRTAPDKRLVDERKPPSPSHDDAEPNRTGANKLPTNDLGVEAHHSTDNITTCSVCSLENEPDSALCMACSNVLKPSLMPNHWRCHSEACKDSAYINAGDFGRCGLCGAQKPAAKASKAGASRPVGVIGADVLRWD